MKSITPLTIDEEIKKRAKEKGLNMSQIAELAIRDKLGKIEFAIDEPTKCDFCGIEMGKATADNPDVGLNWLWPDERWICQRCLRTKINKVIAGKTY
jgi:hypothetical protein